MNLQQMMAAAEGVASIVGLVSTALPAVESMVVGVEKAMPGAKGTEKLEAVRGALSTAYSVEQSLADTFSKAWPTFASIIASIVAFKNSSGLFQKASSAPSTAPAA